MPVLNEEQLVELREIFEMFKHEEDTDGKVDLVYMRSAAINLGLKNKNPTIMSAIQDLINDEKKTKTKSQTTLRCSFDEFVNALLNHLNDTHTERGIREIFSQFADPDTETITLHSLRDVARELHEDMSHEDVHHMLLRGASNNEFITFDDFYAIMRPKWKPNNAHKSSNNTMHLDNFSTFL